MATVKFTSNLKRFYPALEEMSIDCHNVGDLLKEIDSKHPGIRDYIVDETGALRKHVNIFIGNDMIRDRSALSDSLSSSDQVYVMQALSGG